jgi:hypothetical protein
VTIRIVQCSRHQVLGITEDEWVLLIKTIGRIKSIEDLRLYRSSGSRDFHPLQAIADAVNSAQAICRLVVVVDGESGEVFPRDSAGLTALASALQEHTGLQDFRLLETVDWSHTGTVVAMQGTDFDPVLRALPACPHLRKVYIMITCANAGAIKNLLQSRTTTELCLALNTEQWLAMADGIR